jgi:hypothetical protein
MVGLIVGADCLLEEKRFETVFPNFWLYATECLKSSIKLLTLGTSHESSRWLKELLLELGDHVALLRHV